MIEFDIREFKKDATKMLRNDYPAAVAMFTKILAGDIQREEQRNLPEDLKLKSGWIPKNINAFPKTRGQVNKLKRDVRDKHKFISSVSGSERIAFMSGHNEGMVRRTQSDWKFGPDRITNRLALPSKTLKSKAYRNRTGKVKDMYYPTNLMRDWKGKNARRKGKKTKKPFLMILPNSKMPVIARRKKVKNPKSVEILWFFGEKANIKKDWFFDEVGLRELKKRYKNAMIESWNKVK